jgi:hypothetical protein
MSKIENLKDFSEKTCVLEVSDDNALKIFLFTFFL